MTYEEFKCQVRKLGLNVYVFDTLIEELYINVKNDDRTVYYIDTKKRYCIYSTDEFCDLDESLQKKLFNLVTLLAKTSIENRGDLYKETKWYLRHKYLNVWHGENYLIDCGSTTGLSLGYNTGNTLTKCRFTKYEIEELKKKINFNDFEMEKVE